MNPHLTLGNLLLVATQAQSLPADAYGGVSSFGFSGTNCHVILQSVPRDNVSHTLSLPAVIVISAKTESSLMQLARSYSILLQQADKWMAASICFSSVITRVKHRYKLGLVVSDPVVAAQKLNQFSISGAVTEEYELFLCIWLNISAC